MSEITTGVVPLSCGCYEMAALLSERITKISVVANFSSEHIAPGWLVWVKEIATPKRFQSVAGVGVWRGVEVERQNTSNCFYKVDTPPIVNPHWKSSLSMPQWASRVTLEAVKVKPRRLQEIDDSGAFLEGVSHWVEWHQVANGGSWWGDELTGPARRGLVSMSHGSGLQAYKKIWDIRHQAKPHLQWVNDPVVIEIDFRLHFKNILEILGNGCENKNQQKAV